MSTDCPPNFHRGQNSIESSKGPIGNSVFINGQILEANPSLNVLFGEWLAGQGLDAKGQHSYMKSGWLNRLSRGVYALQGTTPTLYNAVAAYNTQLDKHCIVGAYTALELRGYSHYLSLGSPTAFLFTSKDDKLPAWMLQLEWDMGIKYMTTSFLGDDRKGVESLDVNGSILLVSSPERAILECLNLPDSSVSLLNIYYIMESLTTLRPKLVQTLLEACTSQKVKREDSKFVFRSAQNLLLPFRWSFLQ